MMGPVQLNFAVDIVDACAEDPAAVAIEWHGPAAIPLRVTYHDLKLRSDKVAYMLREHGLRLGDRVVILLPLCVAWWESILGCMKAGGIAALADEVSTHQMLVNQLTRSQATMLVADVSLAQQVDDILMYFPSIAQKIAVGWNHEGWVDYNRHVSLAPVGYTPVETDGHDLCLVHLPENPQAEETCYRHGETRFNLDFLDAWRKGMTVIVHEQDGGARSDE